MAVWPGHRQSCIGSAAPEQERGCFNRGKNGRFHPTRTGISKLLNSFIVEWGEITGQNVSMKLGYIRVSTRGQDTARQIDALEAHCDELVIEKIGATVEKRPLFDEALGRLKKGDSLVILDLDRAFRSTVEALLTFERLHDRGVEFQIVNQGIETSTDIGKVIYGVLALFAEFELKNTRRRTREGLQAAKRRGKTLGRPKKLSPDQISLARREIDAGHETLSGMAEILGVDRKTLRRNLRNAA